MSDGNARAISMLAALKVAYENAPRNTWEDVDAEAALTITQ